MNLKSQLQYKVTAVVKIIDNKTAIVSDECSPTHHGALTIVKAASKEDLWRAVRDKCRELASNAKFRCTIALINQQDELQILKDEQPVIQQPMNINDYQM